MGTARKNVNLSTGKHNGSSSVFLIDIEPSKVAYFYDVELFTMQGNVQKKKITGAFVELNRKISVELVRIALNKSGYSTSKAAFVYDGRKNIYLSEELKSGQNEWIVLRKEVSDFVRQNYDEGVNFKVCIKPCQTGHHILNLDDFAQYEKGRNNSVDQEDRSLRTFLELAIAQKAWESGKFFAYGSGLLFDVQEDKNIIFRSNPAITFHSGFCKGVRIVEGMGKEGKGQPAVVLDAKVSAFLKPQILEKTIGDFFRGSNEKDWKKVAQFLNGVKVKCVFEPSRILTIGGFGEKALKDETFPMEKKGKIEEISVVNYLKEKYRKMNLKNLEWPGIFTTTSNRDARFPVEQLMVLEGQKIPQEKQTPDLVDILLKKNSIPPQERHKKIEEAGKELELWNGKNKVLETFGIKVRPNSNDTNFNVFAAPHLLYKGKEVVPNGDKGDWSKNSGTFIDARAPNKWAVLYAKSDEKNVQEFIKKMKEKCVEKGMKVPQMLAISKAQQLFDPNSGKQYLDEWRGCFKMVYNKEFDFLLLIDEKMTNTHSHGLLKLFEVFDRQGKLPLITQQITMETVKNVLEQNRWQTLDNIVNKMNIKFGGLNYKPILQNAQKSELAKFEQRFDVGNGDILVIGYDVSHPTQKIHENRKWGKNKESEFEEFEEDMKITSTEPSVVGICANMAENPHNFVGDYFYQKAKKEAVDLDQLKARSKWILASLEANRPKQSRPKCIFVIRDGLSEGQLRMAYKEELKAIKDGFLEHDPNYRPKFALIIGNKRHSKKLFSVAQEQIENMPPCSVIQDKIVRLDIDEFYMQPHYPIKGTGKPVEYVVLVNEIAFGCSKSELQEYAKLIDLKVPKITQKELEERMFEKSLVNLLLLLSYDHQIVSKPISLTEPAYQADELAKRGHANFATLKQFFPDEIPYSDEKRIGKNLVDYAALTAKLSYWGDGLVALKNRFTA